MNNEIQLFGCYEEDDTSKFDGKSGGNFKEYWEKNLFCSPKKEIKKIADTLILLLYSY